MTPAQVAMRSAPCMACLSQEMRGQDMPARAEGSRRIVFQIRKEEEKSGSYELQRCPAAALWVVG